VHLVVTAVPTDSTMARLGERFVLRDGAPLHLGPSRQARLRMGHEGADDLLIGIEGLQAFIRGTIPGPHASLSGQMLPSVVDLKPSQGDSLYIHPGFVVQFREVSRQVTARNLELEEQVIASNDDSVWAVYLDFLHESGDPLHALLQHEPSSMRSLGALAESVRAGLAEVSWSPRGFLSSLALTRKAVEEAPGLAWHLRVVAQLPVARLLPRLSISLFAGAPHPGVAADIEAAQRISDLSGFDGVAHLRALSLGFVSQPRPWPQAEAAFAQLRIQAPHLCDWGEVLFSGTRGTLDLVQTSPHIRLLADHVILNPRRSEVGSAARCLVRLVGDVPEVLCTVSRNLDGEWMVFDESADPFRPAHGRLALRVNGTITPRATLAPGDIVEPVEGVLLRFELS
jgi:hypothetical protein